MPKMRSGREVEGGGRGKGGEGKGWSYGLKVDISRLFFATDPPVIALMPPHAEDTTTPHLMT